MRSPLTREEWLYKLASLLRQDFASVGAALPTQLHVSCGWPTHQALAVSGKSRTVGQCFSSACSADGTIEIFVSPKLSNETAVGAVLTHELVHAALNCTGGHGATFKRLATSVGLEGKMTATVAGERLTARLNTLIAQVGAAYPHAELDVSAAEKKQGTRMIKLVCPNCGYTVRTTKKWIAVGLPTCVCGDDMRADGADDEGGGE
jgi:SprT-like family protein